MTTETILIENEAQWLAERAKDVTSTQVAALFGVSPYLTEFELWHQKRNGIVEAFEENNRTRWGNRLEETIAKGFAEEAGLATLHRPGVYLRRVGQRIGASFDFFALCQGELCIIECKNVDSWEHKENWLDTEAPGHIELQVQTQLLLSGYRRAFIVALVGGNNLVVHEREPDAEVQAAIVEKVTAFWSSVDAGIEPKPDFVRDADLLLSRIYNRSDGTEIEADAETLDLLNQWLAAKSAADTVKPLQARIAERIGTASKVRTPQGVLSCATNKAGARPFRYYPNKETSNV